MRFVGWAVREVITTATKAMSPNDATMAMTLKIRSGLGALWRSHRSHRSHCPETYKRYPCPEQRYIFRGLSNMRVYISAGCAGIGRRCKPTTGPLASGRSRQAKRTPALRTVP